VVAEASKLIYAQLLALSTTQLHIHGIVKALGKRVVKARLWLTEAVHSRLLVQDREGVSSICGFLTMMMKM
jgi:hypothetical protein